MRKKIVCILIMMLMTTTIISATKIEKKGTEIDKSLIPPDIDYISENANMNQAPGFYETSEYMIGSIAVGGIFLESNGAIDPNTEIWTPVEELNVQTEIAYALTQWWESQNPNANVDFIIDWKTKVPISYEPIIHPSAITTDTYEKLWVSEAMANLGYSTGDWMQRTRSYINALRQSKGTDWAFAIFIVDSSNDFATDPSTPGSFSDGFNAYAYIGGPFCVLTYDNGLWGISRMHQVIAHETAHIFWATEEYNQVDEWSGYLNAKDTEGSGCLMDTNALCLSVGTKKQIGWLDSDSDGILDILDTNPQTHLNPYSPDPTSSTTLVYEGTADIVPYPNNNPCFWNSGNDVTINTIANVEYKVDSGSWQNANSKDGAFDSESETFTMTISSLSVGTHTITARAVNSVGNYDLSPSSDTVTISSSNTKPNKPSKPSGTTSGKVNTEYTYTTSTIDPDGNQVYYLFDWGDGTNSGWVGPYNSGVQASAKHTWTSKSNYQIKVKAKDTLDVESDWSDPLDISMPKAKFIFLFGEFLEKYPFLNWIFSILFM